MKPATICRMPTFMIEIPIADAGPPEFERALRVLVVAQSRTRETPAITRTILAGLSREDGSFICLIEAATIQSARRLVRLALLPPGRIREITRLVDMRLLGGGYPGGDVDPRLEAELVEDVVDVSLDRSLREE